MTLQDFINNTYYGIFKDYTPQLPSNFTNRFLDDYEGVFSEGQLDELFIRCMEIDEYVFKQTGKTDLEELSKDERNQLFAYLVQFAEIVDFTLVYDTSSMSGLSLVGFKDNRTSIITPYCMVCPLLLLSNLFEDEPAVSDPKPTLGLTKLYKSNAIILNNMKAVKLSSEPAAEEPKYSEGLEFTSNGDGTCYVSGPKFFEGDVSIPPKSPNGDTVTAAGHPDATTNDRYILKGISSIIFPDTVTTINPFAFTAYTGSRALAKVVFGKNIREIKEYAFNWCENIKEIDLPNGLLSIGKNAFDGTHTTDFIVPDSVISLGSNFVSFGVDGNCSLTYGKGITTISWNEGVSSSYALKTITFRNSDISISGDPWSYCGDISTFNYPGTMSQWKALDFTHSWSNDYSVNCSDGWVSKDGTEHPNNESEIEPPDEPEVKYSEGLTFTSYNNGTCYLSSAVNCEDTDINIPPKSPEGDMVIEVGDPNATDVGDYIPGILKATSINLPPTVKKINPFAFTPGGWNPQNSKLTKVDLGIVEEIGQYAFSNCIGLAECNIPNTCHTIGDSVFTECKSLKGEFKIPSSIKNWGNRGFLASTSIETLTFEEGTTQIPYCGQMSDLTTINIPKTVESIDSDPFAYSSAITTVNYGGTMSQWKAYGDIRIGWSDQPNIYCSDGYIDKDGIEHPNE